MKKTILIFAAVIVTLSLTAFGINWQDFKTEKASTKDANKIALNTVSNKIKKESININEAENYGPIAFNVLTEDEFIYDVGSRFAPIKKSVIDNATSIHSFYDEETIHAIEILKYAEIIIVENDIQTDTREITTNKELTEAQLNLLQNANYGSNFLINIVFQKKNKVTGLLEYSNDSPHLTIVPEKEATYKHGKDALKKFLRENSLDARLKAKVDPNTLQAAKLKFTVTKEGGIKNISLDRSSSYPLVDETMKSLILETQGSWKPAENAKGEKTDQELVVSFGTMGC
ncbi:hypothetical protein Q4512_04020 [Oceanihabitans sp. 2_MG-2023]|uniref:energy transducer TonB n=1 Tax=Oceanihabitans sp. 2_MG-2023 TaxID=3062661 RepID=UPI0026E1627C|nr:hypothetical protein [Oceanihabitans sp. 2_MG-2023]MDO6596068.1 hypothetical protein [Oceanihabitans sp. 2_MG-2023]